MVEKDKIHLLLRRFYAYHGRIEIDDNGLVSCIGSVEFTAKMPQMPVRFAVVEGSFKLVNRGVKTLLGSPHTVGVEFNCSLNPITSWQHAPTTVKYTVHASGCKFTDLVGVPHCKELLVQHNPLRSLDGMPENLHKIGFSFDRDLPMLRALQAKNISLYNTNPPRDDDYDIAVACDKILKKYAGQGHAGSLACAAELSDAGLKKNAAW